MLSVSTITPVRNDAASLPTAVAGIQAQDFPVDRIVLAVGPSSDGSLDVALGLAKHDARIVVIDNPTGRTPAALNLAIAQCDTEVVVRVDARAFLGTGYVAAAVDALIATGAGNVGAVQRAVGESRVQRGIAAAMQSRFGSGGAAYRGGGTRRRVDTAWLGAFRRDALVAVGGYDEDFIRNQDAELNLRLDRAGYEVWLEPELVVDYRPRDTLWKLATQYYQYGWWRLRTVRKHRGSLRFRQLAAPILVLGLVVSLFGAVLVSPWFLLVPTCYLATMIFGASRLPGALTERMIAAAALIVMHVSWGTGFLVSLVKHSVVHR